METQPPNERAVAAHAAPEIRTVTAPVEFREQTSTEAAAHVGTLHGYALLFDEATDLRDFREVVTRTALDGVIERADVRALFNHDANLVLGRSPQTLRLEVDERGLRYEIDLPNTQAGRDVAELTRRGDVKQSSYAFRVDADGFEWDHQTRTRTIHRFADILDVSPVTYPANPNTEAAMRSAWTPPADPAPATAPADATRSEAPNEPSPAAAPAPAPAAPTQTAQRHQTQPVTAPNSPKSTTTHTRPMNSNELKAQRAAALAELKAVTDGLTTENRAANEAETSRFDALNAKIADLDAAITRAETTEANLRRAALNAAGGSTDGGEARAQADAAKRYSLTKAIYQSAFGRLDGLEAEMAQEATREIQRAGKGVEGRVQIPGFIHTRATSVTTGTNLPGAGSSGLLEGLTPNPVIERLGAQRLTGITGDIILPTLASNNTTLPTETGAISSGDAIAARKLVANRIGSRVDISAALLAQMNESVDRVVASQFAKATAAKMDRIFLADVIANVTYQKRRDTAAATVPGLSSADAAHLRGVVGDNGANLDAGAFITSHGALAYAMHTPTVTGGGIPIMVDGRVLGSMAMGTGEAAPALITDASFDTAGEVYAVPGLVTNLDNEAALVPIVFADFSDVYVGIWANGAMDLIIDPYKDAETGVVRIISNIYADAKLAHLGAASWTVGA